MGVDFFIKRISLCLLIASNSYADNEDWVQNEVQWWNQQQKSFQKEFDQTSETLQTKTNSEFKLSEKYWEKIKPYFFQNNTYVGYCVLDAYNTKLPLIITKVRSRNAYSIAVDVNVYKDNIKDTVDLKICHTDDLLNGYDWTDSQSVRYDDSKCIYEMYFKLCPLNQYPKTNIPGILIPLETGIKKNISNPKLNKQLKDGMESIWKNTNNEAVWNKTDKKEEAEILQASTMKEIQSWQAWFKEALHALNGVNFDFKKYVINPVCTDKALKSIFEKHFGEMMAKEELAKQFNQKFVKLSETIGQMKNQEKELRAEIEALRNRILGLQTEKTPQSIAEENLEQPNYITKDGRKIGKLKRVEGDNILDAIKQYQDDDKNEKSNLSEESIKQMQEESRQKMLMKAQENMESSKRAEIERSKGVQQFGSNASNMTAEMNQLFTHSNDNEEFDPKAALKRIKEKDSLKKEPKKMESRNEPGKLQLDNGFKRNMEAIFGGFNDLDSEKKLPKKNLKTPGKLKINPAFEEKLKNDLGAERKH